MTLSRDNFSLKVRIQICTHKGILEELLLEGIDDQAITQSLVAVSKQHLLSTHLSHIYLMVYSWETSSVDQTAVSFLCYRSEWIKLHLVLKELLTSDLLYSNGKSQYPHIDETFVCVTRARATSWKPHLNHNF